MDKRIAIMNGIKEQGLLPLYFHPDAAVSTELLNALYDAGCRAIEYTNRGKQALTNFEQLRKIRDKSMEGMFLGAGTIKDAAAASDFIKAGADFLVSPGLAEDVFDISYSEKILWMPGCMTVTEIIKAEQFGIEFIKLFPGNLLGPSFMQAIRDIFPNISFMPTGGVEPEKENLRAWIDAGVSAVGMGSRLISKSMLEKKEYGALTELTKEVLGMIRGIREKKGM